MKIAILSDIHDNLLTLRKALAEINDRQIEQVIFCGDFCAPFVLIEIIDSFKGRFDYTLGNVDGDETALSQIADEHDRVNYHKPVGAITLDNTKIAFVHYPDLAEGLAATGKYDVVFHGHTHEKREEKIGDTLLINPGEIMGRKADPTFAIFDTKNPATTEFIPLGKSIFL